MRTGASRHSTCFAPASAQRLTPLSRTCLAGAPLRRRHARLRRRSLARLMGHKFHSIEPSEEGRSCDSGARTVNEKLIFR